MVQAYNSREVCSTQTGIHPRLDALVDRHLSSQWAHPLHEPSVKAFRELERMLDGRHENIVLDSGCGTGESTRLMAQTMPTRFFRKC